METTTLTFALTWQRCLRLFKYTRILSFSPQIIKIMLNLQEDFVLTLHCDGASQLYPPKGKPFGCLPDQVISSFNLYIHCNEKSFFYVLLFSCSPIFYFSFFLFLTPTISLRLLLGSSLIWSWMGKLHEDLDLQLGWRRSALPSCLVITVTFFQ